MFKCLAWVMERRSVAYLAISAWVLQPQPPAGRCSDGFFPVFCRRLYSDLDNISHVIFQYNYLNPHNRLQQNGIGTLQLSVGKDAAIFEGLFQKSLRCGRNHNTRLPDYDHGISGRSPWHGFTADFVDSMIYCLVQRRRQSLSTNSNSCSGSPMGSNSIQT